MARKLYRLQLAAVALQALACIVGAVYLFQALSDAPCAYTRSWLAAFALLTWAGLSLHIAAQRAEINELVEDLNIAQDALSWGADRC